MPTVSDLGRLVKQKHPGQYDDLADSTLGAKVKAKFPGSYDDFSGTTAKATQKSMMKTTVGSIGNQVRDVALGSLPLAGAISGGAVGSVAGPGGSLLGAGFGAAGGEAWKQNLGRLAGVGGPETSAEAWRKISDAAQQYSLADLLGQGTGKLLKAATPGIMRAAILPGKAIREAFRDVGKTALEEGVAAGPGMGGAVKTGLLKKASSKAEEDLLAQAHSAGVVHTLEDLAQPMIEKAEAYLGRPLSRVSPGGAVPPEYERLIGHVREVAQDALKGRTFGAVTPAVETLTPAEMRIIKQYAQDESKLLLKARRAGTASAATSASDIHAAVAQSAKALNESIRVPYGSTGRSIGEVLKEQTQRTQNLIGLNRAVRNRELGDAVPIAFKIGARGGPAVLGGTLGALSPGTPTQRAERGALGATMGAGLGSPQFLSLLAHSANNPLLFQLFKQSPKLAAALFKSAESEATSQ
jgi:hypothetical protein